MVVFTCYHCGEALQKPKVEKHYNTVCRTFKVLTCVDCLKDFKGEEYAAHIKCFTEEERYAAKGSMPQVIKKGEKKQETWVEMIRSIIDKETNLQPPLRNLLNLISGYTNVPRKKAKFINFVKNSTGNRVNFKDIEASWNIIEKYKNEQAGQNNNGTNNNNKRKIENDNSEEPLKKLKTTDNGSNSEKNNENDENSEIFSFKNTILNTVKQKGSISLKKLQKKVLNEYTKETGNEVTEKTIKKYLKKLKKVPNITINDDVVQVNES